MICLYIYINEITLEAFETNTVNKTSIYRKLKKIYLANKKCTQSNYKKGKCLAKRRHYFEYFF